MLGKLRAHQLRRFAASAVHRRAISSVLAANRGEIAIRIMRAGTELDLETVGIYSDADKHSPHRYKADRSYLVGEGLSPVGAYLDIPGIVAVAKRHGADAVHPGYGFLAENADFAQAVQDAGMTFVGPSPHVLRLFGDKTSAREAAIKAGVPVVPGSEGPVQTVEEALEFGKEVGYPIMIKAAYGGGGRGMREVMSEAEMRDAFDMAVSEAQAAFGDGTVFLEKLVQRPRHIEVQIIGDNEGNVVHLFERDCSVQRRHQKVVELAPSRSLDPELRASILRDAVRLVDHVGYVSAGTVEFLVGEDDKYYFCEVNPRVQVEHTVTEEVTGVDIVQSQLRIANGASLADLGIASQDQVKTNGFAIQCRITTEDPAANFAPDSGHISVYRAASGNGVRIDDGPGYTGAFISPHYDSLLVKLTTRAPDFDGAAAKMRRALSEFRIRGVTTNKHFLLGLLSHEDFLTKRVDTSFIAEHPQLLQINATSSRNRGEKLLRYLAEVAVNGPEPTLGATGAPPASIDPVPPQAVEEPDKGGLNLRYVFETHGAEGFAKAVREHEGLLITDTTWRDAHQSLLATRVRTRDLLAVAPFTRHAMRNAYSIECWGGATFDVAMRFLRECPWDRLHALREAVPNVPFQMLLRGANAVGYKSYPDNVVQAFCDQAVKSGMDVFRIFDSLNYAPNLELGIDLVGAAGGIAEAAICYTGDVCHPRQGRYDLDYYLKLADYLINERHTHVLAIKDMAGLLKPNGARLLIGALRKEFPNTPLHLHMHDTSGAGVATLLAAAECGVDAVDVATDSMSGMTSQPSMGALLHALRGSDLDTGVEPADLDALNTYWADTRGVYRPFESGQLAGSSDVYQHEIPGGQATNMMFQSQQLGLAGRWALIKEKYAAANRILGDIPKVTPSSKVVGDLAQFMVANDLSEEQVLEQASSLQFPTSVIEYLQGYLGIPPYGFPEAFRRDVLANRNLTLPNGKDCFEGRPGAELPEFDLRAHEWELHQQFPEAVEPWDVVSSVMYPDVFHDWQHFVSEFGDPTHIPTRLFAAPMQPGQEVSFDLQDGKTLYVKLASVSDVDEAGNKTVTFKLNGETRTVVVADKSAVATGTARVVRADPRDKTQVGAPMPGVVVKSDVKAGDSVDEGQALVVLSAMKMESVVGAPFAGTVERVECNVGDSVSQGDLLAVVQPEEDK